MIDRDKVRLVQKDLESAIEAVAKKHGLTVVKTGGIAYNPTALRLTNVTMTETGSKSPDEKYYEMLQGMHPTVLPNLGDLITYQNIQFRTVSATRGRVAWINVIRMGDNRPFRIKLEQLLGTPTRRSQGERVTIGKGDIATISVSELLGERKGY